MKDSDQLISQLQKHALDLGASDTKIISTDLLPISDAVVEMCQEPMCPSFGQCANCPPHAMSPNDFSLLALSFEKALLFKIDVPPKDLVSLAAMDWFKLLHLVASGVEAHAILKGFARAKGYAAGSCLATFCPGLDCSALEKNKECRHPDSARTSLEAVGVHVFSLAEKVGWKIHKITSQTDPDEVESGMLVGMVLVG